MSSSRDLPFSAVLIANRGEIAVRIARACADAGLTSIAVYADPDADAQHVRAADEAFALPGQSAAETYLDIDKLIDVARRAGADAVHPGYGFLAENADFARAVVKAGLVWIGPPADAIETLGDKVTARHIAAKVGAPLVAGTADPVSGAAEVVAFATEHGLPVAIKAAFGGGGRGLKVAWSIAEIPELFDSAVREATSAFGRGECFVERYLDRPRHVETQCLADAHGDVVVVSTRDCSLQRRHQKLVEEAPAPFLSASQRAELYRASKAILAEAGYVGAGTCEFLVARDGTISFLEVNTRLQVEHPVSEEVTGLDLVREQFRLAAGQPLGYSDPEIRGHSIEFRINGEDPGRGFLPQPGPVRVWQAPSGPSPAPTGHRRCSGRAGHWRNAESRGCPPLSGSTAACSPTPPSHPWIPSRPSPCTPGGSRPSTTIRRSRGHPTRRVRGQGAIRPRHRRAAGWSLRSTGGDWRSCCPAGSSPCRRPRPPRGPAGGRGGAARSRRGPPEPPWSHRCRRPWSSSG